MLVVDRIALDRLGLLVAPAGQTTPANGAATLTELARVGVRITNPAAVTDALAAAVPDIVTHVRARRGGKGVYTPLFAGFPDKLPSFDDVFLRAAFGWSRLAEHTDGEVTLEDVRAAFDFTSLGWWPASSVPQDVPATLSARERQKLLKTDGRIEWADVRLVDAGERDDALRAWMRQLFASPSAPRPDVLADLRELIAVFGVEHIDAATVRFRELRTLLTRVVWDRDPQAVATLGLSPDDVLRLLADLTGSDVSLTDRIRFPKLRRPQRRAIVAALEATPRLSDVFRRRSLWLAVARGLHVVDFDAPRTREVFSRLAATKHDITSTGSRFERALAAGDYLGALDVLAAEAPGVLMRQLRRIASLAGGDAENVEALLAAVKTSGANVPVRVLLAARAQIADNGATYPRVAYAKSGDVLAILRNPGHLALTGDVVTRLLEALDAAVTEQLAGKESWAGRTVFLDPAASSVLVPDMLRTTAAGLIQVERGSALAAGQAKAVRLFVHWKHENSDLDLSAIVFDENMALVDQVSWTHLRSGAMVHSGDITSAPAGAQEFIDIDLAAARSHDRWRYIAPVIFRYSGVTFDELEEVAAGWMLRDHVSSDRMVFDPATVSNAFPLTGGKRSAVPFVFDLVTGDVVYIDCYLRGHARARVERDGNNIAFLAKASLERRHIKANVADLVAANVTARGGQLVGHAADADLTFGFGPGYTYDVLRPEALLADLL